MARCKATAGATGQQCKLPAIRGGTVCGKHGGGSPKVRAAANRRLAEQAARQALAREKVEPVSDPVGELAMLAGEVLALKRLLGERIAGLRAEDWSYQSKAGEQVHGLVLLLERAQDRAGRLLNDLAKLDLGGRMVRAHEVHVALFYDTLRIFAEASGRDWSDPAVRADAARAIEGASADDRPRSPADRPRR